MKQSMVRSAQLHHISASIILALAAVALLLGFNTLRDTLAETPRFVEGSDRLRFIDMLHDGIHSDVVGAVSAAARGDAEELRAAGTQSAEHVKRLQQAILEVQGLIRDPKLVRMFADLQPALQQYAQRAAELTDLAQRDAPAAARELYHFRQLFTALTEPMDGLVSATKALVADQIARADAAVRWLGYLLIALGLLSVFDRTQGIVRARKFATPIIAARDVAQQIAAGDLTADTKLQTSGETGELLTALRNMRNALSGIVGNVRQSADAVAQSSEQLRAGSTDLSQRTEEQAASLEQTAASMDEFTSTVKQNADNAQQASELARTAAGLASRGGEVVGQVVKTMGGIQDSSNKIAEIIAVIDGIAFQTNILALNAAVEAARAGDQGRGFAVVASEVRSLAQRSAAAAKEIKELISASVDRVKTGSTLVSNAGQGMDEIVESVRRVSDLISAIAQASREQSLGIQQVSQTVVQLEQVTQQNAAVVQQVASSAEAMKDQAQDLRRTVSVFRLADMQADSAPRAAAPASAAKPVMDASPTPRAPAAKLANRNHALAAPPRAKPAQQQAAANDKDDDWQEF